MKVFHGSRNDFEVFNFDHIRGNGSEYGVGFYTTTNKELALIYAKPYLYTYNFKGKKSFVIGERQLSRGDIKKLIDYIEPETCFLSNYGEVGFDGYETVMKWALDNIYNEIDDDVEMLGGIACVCGDDYTTIYNAVYELFGFDSIQATMNDSDLYIATTPKALELIKQEVIEK